MGRLEVAWVQESCNQHSLHDETVHARTGEARKDAGAGRGRG